MGLHKSSHMAGAREIGLMGAMASCAPPNTLLIAAPTPRPCPAPTPLSTAATQTELTMVDLSKLESELVELKVEDEYRRFKQRGYARKSRGKKKVDECMRIWNEENAYQEQEYRRLKKNAYQRELYRKAAAKKKELKRMLIDANQEQEYKRLKKNAYQREYYRKLAAKNKELKRMLTKAEDGELAASGA